MPLAATKTPHRNKFLTALAQVNDQVCFLLFLDGEVGSRWQTLADTRPTEFTSDVFPENQFSDRIYVTMDRLLNFRSEQLNVSLGVSFAFAIEELILYIETVLKHWGQINGLTLQITEPIDDCFSRVAAKNARAQPEVNFIRTVKYLRLRRNHVIHSSGVLAAEFSKALKYDGPQLQAFWESRTSIPGIAFDSTAMRQFSAEGCITLIKLARICLEELDAYVAAQLDAEGVLRKLDAELLERQPELRAKTPATVTRRVRKIKKRVLELYGLRALPAEVAGAIGQAI